MNDIWIFHPNLGLSSCGCGQSNACDRANLSDLGPETFVLALCKESMRDSVLHIKELCRMFISINRSVLSDSDFVVKDYMVSETPRSMENSREFVLCPKNLSMKCVMEAISPRRAGT